MGFAVKRGTISFLFGMQSIWAIGTGAARSKDKKAGTLLNPNVSCA